MIYTHNEESIILTVENSVIELIVTHSTRYMRNDITIIVRDTQGLPVGQFSFNKRQVKALLPYLNSYVENEDLSCNKLVQELKQ